MEPGFLAEASTTLAASLDPAVILDRLVHLTLAAEGDFCTVDLVDPVGRRLRTHGGHAHRDDEDCVQRYVAGEEELPATHPVRRSILSGTALLYPHVTNELLSRAATPDPDALEALARLAPRSMMVVPLIARGRVLGALAVFSSDTELTFGSADLAMTEELARRAALALDNARLYREAQAAEARTQEHLGRIKALSEASRLFVESGLDLPAITQAVVRSVAALGDLCLLRLVSEDRQVLRPAALLAGNETALGRVQRDGFFLDAPPSAQTGFYRGVLTGGRPLRVERIDHLKLPEPDRALFAEMRMGSLLAAPLPLRDHPVGLLIVGRQQGAAGFSKDDQIFLEDVSYRAALALQNARLYEQAQDASRLRDEFLATLSHELRTPLTAILGWTQMLRTGRHSAAALPRALTVIERNARAQARLVEDLLDVSRITNGKLQLEMHPIEFLTPVDAAVEALRPTAQAKDVELDSVLDPSVGKIHGDVSRLQQVVWNLISNAVKFTPAGGRVEVRLERQGDQAVLSVTDTGEGISPDFAPHVFERFRQADGSTTRRHAGLGLGLSIVRHLVELHGGTVRVESPGIGKGSRFIVRLPRLDAAVPANVDMVAQPELFGSGDDSLDGLRILVVDDEPDSLEVVAQLLRRRGARVTARNSAEGAMQALRQTTEAFDVLVSDIGMPGQDGYALVRQVRTVDALRDLPAIALTAYARAEDRARAIEEGFQMHVAKPVDPLELASVVANLARAAVDH